MGLQPCCCLAPQEAVRANDSSAVKSLGFNLVRLGYINFLQGALSAAVDLDKAGCMPAANVCSAEMVAQLRKRQVGAAPLAQVLQRGWPWDGVGWDAPGALSMPARAGQRSSQVDTAWYTCPCLQKVC